MRRQTIFLARLFGLGLTVTAVWMLLDEPDLSVIVQAFIKDRPLTFLLSLICLASGLAVVLGHQLWSGGIAPVLVTVLGCLLVLRGLLLLFLPTGLLETLAGAVSGPAWLYSASVVALGLGLILTFAGFRAQPIVAGEH